MNYSIINLTQVADCNALLSWAAKEKATLNFKKLSEQRLTEKFAETSIELDAVLQGIIAELAATINTLPMLPEGSKAKNDALDKIIRLEYKKFLLENRRESYGTVALLEKEMDLGRILNEIEEVDAFIAAVEGKKATLPQPN